MSKSFTAYPEVAALFAEGEPYFKAIPRLPHAAYCVTIEWTRIESALAHYINDYGLNLDPDYQRGHVWSDEQQIAYVEYQLIGGEAARTLLFVSTDWTRFENPNLELLDGKQRLQAVRRFLQDEIPAFGRRYSEFKDRLRGVLLYFNMQVIEVPDRATAIRLYLQHNGGGVVHTAEELARVRGLLAAEQARTKGA